MAASADDARRRDAAPKGGSRGQRAPDGGGRKPGQRGRAGPGNETVSQLTGPLRKVLARLPATQRKVLELRMGLTDGHPHDLADTARTLGLSLSEARDIEQRAFAHIREAVPLQQLQRFLPRD
jgi:DNA-directed RNA polymerase specialized sigma24 family protein